MLTLEERYGDLIRETETAFGTDLQYLLYIARISYRVVSKRG